MGFILLGLAGESIQLVPDGTLLLHGALIILMVVVLNRTLFKPINKILQERDRRTRGLLTEAEQTLVSIDKSLRQYEQTLRRTKAEGYQLLERQRSDAILEREQQIASARELLSKQTSAEKQEIRSQAEAARTLLSKEATSTALRISSQILGRPVASEGE
ncbi:MAG: ATP synthase F0 subunit B [Pyrinomonadaceae bacterium]|nr:ATP synthase F0 subunit B [Pyrinomonadaceae bacterium]